MKFKQTESDLQRAVAGFLNHLGWLWFHCPNGGARSAITGAKLKEMGVKRGVPDILIMERWDTQVHKQVSCPSVDRRGFGVAIELKVGRGKLTEEQEEWLAALRERGWLARVCRSVGDVKRVLECVEPMNGRTV